MSIIAKGVCSLVHPQLWPAATRRHRGAAAWAVTEGQLRIVQPVRGESLGVGVFRDKDLGLGLLVPPSLVARSPGTGPGTDWGYWHQFSGVCRAQGLAEGREVWSGAPAGHPC